MASVDWGDGLREEADVEQRSGSGTNEAWHVYTATGEVQLTMCVADDDEGQGCDLLPVVVRCGIADVGVELVETVPAYPLTVVAQILNLGGTMVPAGMPVAFYLVEPGGSDLLIGSGHTTSDLGYDDRARVSVTWYAPPGDHTIAAVADDDGLGGGQMPECDEDNRSQASAFIPWRLYLPIMTAT